MCPLRYACTLTPPSVLNGADYLDKMGHLKIEGFIWFLIKSYKKQSKSTSTQSVSGNKATF